jgi:uncharacterized protein YwgA
MTDDLDFDLYGTVLADSWDSLPATDSPVDVDRTRKDRQLNLRVSADLLSTLRSVAATRNESYHSLARAFIEQGLVRSATPTTKEIRPFSTKEATLVLLAAPGASRQPNEEISGRTRLQKLLFLLTQHLKPDVQARFEGHHFGPFEENLSQDIEFLESEGLIEAAGHGPVTPLPPSRDRGARLVEWVESRSGPANDLVESYRLTKRGMDWVSRFLSDREYGDPEAKTRLLEESARLKEQYGRSSLDSLIDYVYNEYPEYAEKSKIREQVAERRRQRIE